MMGIDDFEEGGKFRVRFSAGENGTSAWLRAAYEPGSFSVWTVVRDGTRVIICRNGEVATRQPEYQSNGTNMNLGLLMGMRPFVNNFKGELAEILIFNESLSTEERHLVESYLMGKYDLGF
ncbi:LamG-like jellyroll fold domain-containing protein [Candidatus Poribacteria bacterium]